MRRLLSGDRIPKTLTGETKRRVPTSTMTIVPSDIVFRLKRQPNYPITITIEGGAFYLESILIKKRRWSLSEMRRSVTVTERERRFAPTR